MPASAEQQAKTLDKFIEGWAKWTPADFLATWSDNCAQITLPFSSEVPIRTRAHTEKPFPVLMSLLSNFEVCWIYRRPSLRWPKPWSYHQQLNVHNVLHDSARNKAVVYAITKAESPFGPYKNEHACFVWFDESGEKIDKIEEMFDGVFMEEFLPKLDKYVAEHGCPTTNGV